MLGGAKRRWRFNQSPLFLEFLQGKYDLECTPWGNPTYNLFGWQKPCYLVDEGYAATFAELLETTEWSKYGGVLAKVQKKLQEAANTMEEANLRNRAVGRKLRDVQELPASEAAGLLRLEAGMGIDGEEAEGENLTARDALS